MSKKHFCVVVALQSVVYLRSMYACIYFHFNWQNCAFEAFYFIKLLFMSLFVARFDFFCYFLVIYVQNVHEETLKEITFSCS